MGIDVTLQRLADLISSRKVGTKGYLVLMDDNGQVLAHPNADIIGQSMLGTEVANRVLGVSYGEFDYEESSKMFAAFSLVERTGWSLGALGSYEEADEYVQSSLRRLLLIAVVLLVAAFLIGSLFANYLLVRPVLGLASAAEKIGQGDFTTEVTLEKADELGVLAETFRKLQRDLGKLIGDVKAASNATAELSRAVFRSSQEISASTEEMAATTSEFAGSCSGPVITSSPLTKKAAIGRFQEGQAVIHEAVAQMQNLVESFSRLHRRVEELSVKSTRSGRSPTSSVVSPTRLTFWP